MTKVNRRTGKQNPQGKATQPPDGNECGVEEAETRIGGTLGLSRNSIFQIMEKNNSIQKEAERIDSLFGKNELVYSDIPFDEGLYTIKNYVSKFCFHKWKGRGHCIDFNDFLETVDYDGFYSKARTGNADAFVVFIEIVFNCWKMVEAGIKSSEYTGYDTDFFFLQDIMIDCLSRYNHTAVYDENTERVLVIEDDPAITAVAEIFEPQLSLNVLKYNHYTLRGDIDKKKGILLTLGAELEPKKKTLSRINSTLEDDVFFMLNNLNIRHNNVSPDSKNYKEHVSKMSSETLESWYDELYQMMLLAFLEIDQVERSSRVKALKANINGG